MSLKIAKFPAILSPFLLIAPFFFWGTAMVAMKGAIPQTTPLFMAGVRLVPAGALVLGAAALWKLPQPKGKKAWLWIGIFALLDGLMFQGFLAEGLVRTGAGLGSVMIDSQPIAIALLSSFLFGEVIGVWGALGLIVGVAGISLIGLPDEWIVTTLQGSIGNVAFSWQNLFNNGQWLMLLAALSMATGTVSIRYVSRYADPVVATGWHMILGGIPLWMASYFWESNQWANLDFNGWMALAYATLFGSAIAYGIFFYIASSSNLTSFTALTFLTPIFALLFGNLLLSEVLTKIQWIGVILTLVSIYLINQREQIGTFWKELTTSGESVKSRQSDVPQSLKSMSEGKP
ncbi:DMT family transporter [Lusitaniella coriacea]|uniref:DMT family transporter n=1 Tax=Lusitaniella coriacea TaxID=1983105 RepID=UPI003CF83636